MLVLIEIKGTNWDLIPAHRRMRHLRPICASYRDTSTPPWKTWKLADGSASPEPSCTRHGLPAPKQQPLIENAGGQAIMITACTGPAGVARTSAKGFTETGYARLFDAAHQQLSGPLVVVWDNSNTHVSAAMAGLAAARDWLTISSCLRTRTG